MKLKLDENGHVVVQDGKPVYVHDDGREVPFDAPGAVAKIGQLNGEARGHREAKEAAENKLKDFAGIEDPEAAVKALETVANIDAGKLVQAGKVEEIRVQAKKAAEEQVAAAVKAAAEENKALKTANEQLQGSLDNHIIGGAFTGSKFIGERVAVPAAMMRAAYGKNFKVEEGQARPYDDAGNPIYSRANPGEIAGFEEALEILVSQSPDRDMILKGSGASGGGARPGSGGGGGSKTMTRAEFDKMSQPDRAAKFKDGFKVVDD